MFEPVKQALQTKLPHRSADRCGTSELGRNAAIGFLATVVRLNVQILEC